MKRRDELPVIVQVLIEVRKSLELSRVPRNGQDIAFDKESYDLPIRVHKPFSKSLCCHSIKP